MCKPDRNAVHGSRHVLAAKGIEPKEFEWRDGFWSTPGTGCGTKWSMMAVLGWRYVGPAQESARTAEAAEAGETEGT
jgi:hypothetical protein